MDRKIDTTLEERLSDIDEFIQSELGFPPVSHNSESVTVEELYSISSLFREAGDELLGEQKLYLGVAGGLRNDRSTRLSHPPLVSLLLYSAS